MSAGIIVQPVLPNESCWMGGEHLRKRRRRHTAEKLWWHHLGAPLVVTLILLRPAAMASPDAVDPQLPRYEPVAPPVMGTLRLVVNVAITHLAQAWAEALQAQLPGLQVQAQSFETTVTPPWWDFTTQPAVVVLSEPMTERDVGAFAQRFGYPPMHLGYVPLPAAVAAQELRSLGITHRP